MGDPIARNPIGTLDVMPSFVKCVATRRHNWSDSCILLAGLKYIDVVTHPVPIPMEIAKRSGMATTIALRVSEHYRSQILEPEGLLRDRERPEN